MLPPLPFGISSKLAPSSPPPPLIRCQSAATDSFAGQADGGFWVSQMGDANGGSPGRMVRLGPAPNFTVQGEFPANPPPDFNPHGFAIDTARQRMITAGASLGDARAHSGGAQRGGKVCNWALLRHPPAGQRTAVLRSQSKADGEPRCLSSHMVCADYLELKSTLTDPQLDPRFRGNGTIIYRRTLRVWQLPAFDLVGEFRTGETGLRVQSRKRRTPVAGAGRSRAAAALPTAWRSSGPYPATQAL